MAENLSRKRVLIVDDFADMRAVFRGILRAIGFSEIDQARDGKEAIALLENADYGVVLCDYNLGSGKDGQQVLEEARHRSLIGIDCIFIMVTAENTREMVMSAAEYAPDSYLAKPVTKDLLQTRIGRLLARKANLKEVDYARTRRDYSAALAALDRLIASEPKNLSELIRQKSNILLASRQYQNAYQLFQQVLNERELAWAQLGLGKSLFGMQKYEEAQTVFENLITVDPNLLEAYDCLARTQAARQQFKDAEGSLKRAIDLSPRNLTRQQALGQSALANGDLEIAEKAYRNAVGLAKHSVLNHPAIYANLAKAVTANGQPDAALGVLGDMNKVHGKHPQTDFYAATATALIKQNKGDVRGAAEALHEAELAMNRLAEDDLPGPNLLLEMAEACSQLGEKEQAERLLNRAIANNHDEQDVLLDIVQACHNMDLEYDAQTAIRDVRSQIVKTNNAGVKLIRGGEFDQAIELLSTAADDLPGNKTINLNVAKAIIMKMQKHGVTAADRKRLDHHIERIRRLAPNDWRLHDIVEQLNALPTNHS